MKNIDLKRKMNLLILALAGLFALESCIGLKSDVSFKEDGSGTLALEYRISKAMEALGKQDGNERWLVLPAGRADLERSVRRIPELTLRSFSSRDEGKDLLININLEFANMDALLAFFDYSGKRSAYTAAGGARRLSLVLGEEAGPRDASLEELFSQVGAGYSLDFTFNLPSEGTLTVKDQKGRTLSSPAGSKGRTVSCSFPLQEILNAREGLILEVVF